MKTNLLKKFYSAVKYKKVLTKSKCDKNILNSVDHKLISQRNYGSDLKNDPLIFDTISACMVDNEVNVNQPSIFDNENDSIIYWKEIENLRKQLKKNFGSNGAYTESVGEDQTRKMIANYLNTRDVINKNDKVNFKNVFVGEGISNVFNNIMVGIINNSNESVLVPNPVLNTYKSSIISSSAKVVEYNIIPENENDIDIEDSIKKSIEYSNNNNLKSKVLLIINPNYPTGRLLTRKEIENIIYLANKNNLILFVDESFDEVILNSKDEFISFKKVLNEFADQNIKNSQEMICFGSISHTLNPMNFRGCFAELVNICPDVFAQLYKLFSMMLCSNTIGQMALYLTYGHNDILNQRFSKQFIQKISQTKNNNKNILNKNYHTILDVLNQSGKFEINQNWNNTYYFFPKLKENNNNINDTHLAEMIKNNIDINVEPGSNFNRNGYLRFNKLQTINEIQKDTLYKILINM